MADGHCQGIRSIIRLYNLCQIQSLSHRLLDHLFVGPTESGQTHLCLHGRVFEIRQTESGYGFDYNPPGLGNRHESLSVLKEKDRFDGNFLGMILLQ